MNYLIIVYHLKHIRGVHQSKITYRTTPYPAVVSDFHRSSIFNVISATLNFRLMCRSEDADVWSTHDAIANSHQTAVQNAEIEIGIE